MPNEEIGRVEVREGRGPAPGGRHAFCPDCRRALYSVWTYGPVTPATYNTSFCICDGRWEGWDAADVERNQYLYRPEPEPPVKKEKKRG